jgi:cystathionine beta-synthase
MSGEVAGAVYERDLLDALFTGRAHLTDSVGKHMGPGLPLVGAGETIATARHELESSDAILVVDAGKPVGVLTRADFLSFLAD